MLRQPFHLGSLTLPSNLFCAPLAGCSDLPFRKMTKQFRPGLIYCEMVKMDALIRHDTGTYHLLDYEKEMHPIGAQLCGSKPEIAAESARILEDLGFDVIDLNCGCPVDKVTKDGSGSGLLKHPEKIGEILANIVSAVQVPVTVKIRTGWDENSINAPLITQIAEQAGAKAICIHGRTRAQGYSGEANWEWIRACKEVAKEILVIGNGDLSSASQVKAMFEKTGCDAVLIARGTFGQPWILEDCYALLQDQPLLKRTPLDTKQALLTHLNHILGYKSPKRAALDLRRVGCWYLAHASGAKRLREALNRSRCVFEMQRLIEEFPWEEALCCSS